MIAILHLVVFLYISDLCVEYFSYNFSCLISQEFVFNIEWCEAACEMCFPVLFSSEMTKTVEISAEGGPLGIHVVPFFSSLSGR